MNDQKKAVKEAKKAYKEGNKRMIHEEEDKFPTFKQKASPSLCGILEEEELLPDSFPVFHSYMYVVDDEIGGIKGRVVQSWVGGRVSDLKRDLRSVGYVALNIHRCNLSKRNLM